MPAIAAMLKKPVNGRTTTDLTARYLPSFLAGFQVPAVMPSCRHAGVKACR
jgi:hypothetical protein